MDSLAVAILFSPILIYIVMFVYQMLQEHAFHRKQVEGSIEITLKRLSSEGFISESFYAEMMGTTSNRGLSLETLMDIDFKLQKLLLSCREGRKIHKTYPKKVDKIAQKLGLCNSFTNSELKKAYRGWMNINHPDKNPNANLDEVQQVTAWYNERKSK